MAQDNEGYILYPTGYPEHKIRRIHAKKSHSVSHHAFMYKNEASSCDTPGVNFALCREIYPNLGCSVKISISLSHLSSYS